MFGLGSQFNKVKHTLTHVEINPTLGGKWMIMSYIRFFIEKKYKRVVVLLIRYKYSKMIHSLQVALEESE